MSRLKALSPRIGALPPAVRFDSDRDAHGHSRKAEPWRAWYNLTRWRRLRLEVFQRDHFTCRWPGCGRLEGDTSKLVADHIQPHRGDPALFWTIENLMTLCKPHHDR